MGESACLVRSFSHPSDASREAKEGDPLRALGESISFGRFMSESLAWEKWSAFSHNRYLEEAEKISKPGSVAQKKAYFEAHYKIIAAKKEAALLEQANAATNSAPESETLNEIHNNSSLDPELAKVDSHVAVDKQLEQDAPIAEVVLSADTSGCDSNIERHELEVAKVEGPELVVDQNVNVALDKQLVQDAPIAEVVLSATSGCGSNIERHELEVAKVLGPESVVDQNVNVENPVQIENSSQLEIVEGQEKIVATGEEKMPNKEASNQYSTNKKKPVISSSKSSIYGKASKPPSSPAKQTTYMLPRNGNNAAPNSKKSAGDLVGKKKLTPKSLHMSINFASHAGEISKTSPVFQKIGNSRVCTNSFRISKDSSTPLQTPTRASVNGLLKPQSKTHPLEDRRTKPLLDKSIARVTADGKWHSFSVNCSISSSSSGSKGRSTTISSPFSFRSEERAAKRREFFQKMEEKRNIKEAEKVQLISKDKTQHDLKKLQQSIGFKTKLNEDVYHGSQSPCNHMKKIPPTGPRSPNFGKKPTPSTVLHTNSLPPRRPSVKPDSFRRVTGKNNQSIGHSFPSISHKSISENASPNIQLRTSKRENFSN